MIKAEIAASLILLPAHGFIWAFRFLLMKMSLQHAMPPFLAESHLYVISSKSYVQFARDASRECLEMTVLILLVLCPNFFSMHRHFIDLLQVSQVL